MHINMSSSRSHIENDYVLHVSNIYLNVSIHRRRIKPSSEIPSRLMLPAVSNLTCVYW